MCVVCGIAQGGIYRLDIMCVVCGTAQGGIYRLDIMCVVCGTALVRWCIRYAVSGYDNRPTAVGIEYMWRGSECSWYTRVQFPHPVTTVPSFSPCPHRTQELAHGRHSDTP
jgi:hypothetical protein